MPDPVRAPLHQRAAPDSAAPDFRRRQRDPTRLHLLAQTLATAPKDFYHFTNTVSGDASFNVLANMTGHAWSRTYAVQTIPGLNSFQVTANYQLRRWDDFSAGVATTNIPVVFNYTLRDQSGNNIALTSNSQTFLDPRRQ